MRNWIELCSDVNWVDYHGMWARKAKDGSWYVLRWTNLVDAGGEEFADTPYECDVKRIDLSDVDPSSALNSCGYEIEGDTIVNEYDGSIVADGKHVELCLVECCISYGLGAPLESFTGSKYPERIRATARRYAETMMKDRPGLAKRLARPVNAIGSTADEYGRGDIDSALHRGPFDTAKSIMRKMHGI
jgi:hypothetical protein